MDASVKWGGRPDIGAMQVLYDEASGRLAARQAAEDAAPAETSRRPHLSRRLLVAPNPVRLAAAMGDASLNGARALMGTGWTNRLAAHLPAGWSVGPCCGADDGASSRFEPPEFDRLECSRLARIAASCEDDGRPPEFAGQLRLVLGVALASDDGAVALRLGARPRRAARGDPLEELGTGSSTRLLLAPGEHVRAVSAFVKRGRIDDLQFLTTRGRSSGWLPRDGDVDGGGALVSMEAPPGKAVRSFYGRVAAGGRIAGLGVVYGPVAPAPWAPEAPERFADAARERAAAALGLADGNGSRLAALPEPLLLAVLAYAVGLFDG